MNPLAVRFDHPECTECHSSAASSSAFLHPSPAQRMPFKPKLPRLPKRRSSKSISQQSGQISPGGMPHHHHNMHGAVPEKVRTISLALPHPRSPFSPPSRLPRGCWPPSPGLRFRERQLMVGTQIEFEKRGRVRSETRLEMSRVTAGLQLRHSFTLTLPRQRILFPLTPSIFFHDVVPLKLLARSYL